MTLDLHQLINAPEGFAEQIERIEKTERLSILLEKGGFGESVVSRAIEYPETFMVILNSLHAEHQLKLLIHFYVSQQSIIAQASKNPKLLNRILNTLPEALHLELVESKDTLGIKVIHYVISNPDSLRLIRNVYFKAGQANLLQEWLRERASVLTTAAPNPESLKMLLDLIAEKPLQEELLLKAENILHSAASNTDSLKIILDRVSNKEQLKNLALKNDYMKPNTAFYCALPNAESLKLLLDLIPREQRLNIILNKELLHYAASEPQCLMVLLNSLSEEERFKAIKTLAPQIFRYLAPNPEALQVILKIFTPEQIRLLTYGEDNYGKTALYYAVSNLESLKMILSALPPEARLNAVHNPYYASALHFATANPEALQAILDLLPPTQHLEAAKARDKQGRMTLHHAAQNDKSLNIILKILPQEQRLEYIQTKDDIGRMVLSYAAPNDESLNIILSKLPTAQHRPALIATDKMGRRVWHYAAPNPESLKSINKKLKQEDRALITELDREGKTLLDYAELNPKSLKVIMKASQEDKRLKLLQPTNPQMESVLFKAEDNLECLTILLGLLPISQALDALFIKNKSGDTILHRVAGKPDFLKSILDRFLALDAQVEQLTSHYALNPDYWYSQDPNNAAREKLRQAFNCKDKYGETVLHRAVKNLESLKIILERCPKEILFHAADNDGDTIFYKVLHKPDYLDYLLNACPQSIRCRLLTQANNNGETVVHRAVNMPDLLRLILCHLSPQMFLELLGKLDKQGNKLLHYVHEPQSLEIVLSAYSSKEQLFEDLTSANRNGLWPLHQAVNTPDLLRRIKRHLTEQRFLDLLDKQDIQGSTLLHHVQEPQSLEIVLSAYSEKNRLEIISAKNNKKVSFLASLTNRLDLLSAMLSCFPALVDADGNLVVSQEHLKLFFEIDSPLFLTENNIPSALFLLNMQYVLDKLQSRLKSSVASTLDPMTDHSHDAIRNKRIAECYAVLKDRYQEKYESYTDLSSIERLFKQDILWKLKAEEEKLGAKGNQDILDLLADDNIECLASGKNIALNEFARGLLTSNDDVYHIAWRAYDRESSIHKKAYPKYFAGVSNQRVELVDHEKRESDYIRELTAYLYLSAKDIADDSLLDALILQIAETSRTHSSQLRGDIDAPSCYPGTIARLSLATRSNPLFSVEDESLELLVYIKTQTIVQQLLHEFFTDEERKIEEKELIYTSTLTLGMQHLNDLLTSSPLSQKIMSVTGEEYDIQALIKYRVLFLQSIKNRDSLKIIINYLNKEKGIQCDPFLVEYYMYAALFRFNTLQLSLTTAQKKMLMRVDADAEFGDEAELSAEEGFSGFKTELKPKIELEAETSFEMNSGLDTAAQSMPEPYPKPLNTPANPKMFAPNVIQYKVALAQHLLYQIFKAQHVPQEIGTHLVALILNGTISHMDELENKLQTISPELQIFMQENDISNDIIERGLDEVFESVFRASEARSAAQPRGCIGA